jgi:surface antigen
MPVALRRLCAIPVVVLLVGGVAACGSSSNSSSTTKTTTTATAAEVAVVGRSISVALTPETAEALKHDEVTVSAIAPATAHTTWLLPVSSGHVVAATLSGTIEGTGGIVFSHGEHTVRMTSFDVNTATGEMTALLAGVRRKVFELNLSFHTHATGSNGTLFERDITMTLTSQAATTLNSSLGVSTFKAGEHFGTVTLALAVHP